MLLALAAPVGAHAQAAGADSTNPRGLAGFGSVRWGSDSAAVVASVGMPDTVRSIGSMDARALVYSDYRMGRVRGSLGYLVDRARGLVRVMYLAEYGSGESCLTLYQTLRDRIGERLSGLTFEERLYNDADGLSFCTAFQLGAAGARSVWRDPKARARAWVALDLEAGVVRVSFEGPGFSPPSRAE